MRIRSPDRNENRAVDRYLSTGTIARICQVSPMTIAKWIDEGALPGHTTPGGHRRVAASDLVTFLEGHGMHVPAELRRLERVRVLAVDTDPDRLGRLAAEILAAPERFEYRGTTHGMDALVMVGEWRPRVILLDLDLDDLDGIEICRRLSELAGGNDTRIIALARSADGAEARAALKAGAARCVAGDRLAGRVVDVLEATLNGSVRRPKPLKPTRR